MCEERKVRGSSTDGTLLYEEITVVRTGIHCPRISHGICGGEIVREVVQCGALGSNNTPVYSGSGMPLFCAKCGVVVRFVPGQIINLNFVE